MRLETRVCRGTDEIEKKKKREKANVRCLFSLVRELTKKKLIKKKAKKKSRCISKEAAILAQCAAARLQNVDVLRVSGSQLA